jgi:hypothetical protein
MNMFTESKPKRRGWATTALIALIEHILPWASLTLRVPQVRRFVMSADELVREALFEHRSAHAEATS